MIRLGRVVWNIAIRRPSIRPTAHEYLDSDRDSTVARCGAAQLLPQWSDDVTLYAMYGGRHRASTNWQIGTDSHRNPRPRLSWTPQRIERVR